MRTLKQIISQYGGSTSDWSQHENEDGAKGAWVHVRTRIYGKYKSSTDAVIIGGVIRGGEIIGGVIRGGEIIGGVIWGGEIRGGEIWGGEIIGGVIWGGEIRGGEIWGGEIRGGVIRGGVIWGGVWINSPAQVVGIKWSTNQCSPDSIRCGCEIHTAKEWLSRGFMTKTFNRNGLTLSEKKQYKEAILFCISQMKYVDCKPQK